MVFIKSKILRKKVRPPNMTLEAQFNLPARACNSLFDALDLGIYEVIKALRSFNLSRGKDKDNVVVSISIPKNTFLGGTHNFGRTKLKT